MALFLLTFIFVSELKDTIIINDWWYLGPFSIGPREGITGLDFDFYDKEFQPDTTQRYPGFLVTGGFVSWKKISTSNDQVAIKYENVGWNTIQNYYGIAGLLITGIVYGEFDCNEAVYGLVSAQGVGSFILNGKTYLGDVYRDGYVQIPVVLNKGKNRIILRPGGYGEHSFSFKIFTEPEPLIVIRDITLPDFIQGEVFFGYIGVPVMNTTEKIMSSINIEISGEKILKSEKEIDKIMPFSAVKVPLPIKSKGRIEGKDSTLIRIRVHNNNYETYDSVWIKIKKIDEPHSKTFISKIDSSCQYYAVLPPKNFHSESTYALIMTCHGANVEAKNQVECYAQKEWAYVVAPTNRRRYGFDWQDWGRLDFLEVLDDAKKNFKIDESRIYLTGHSMGGHGVWHIALSHPDLFAAIAPSAGWTSSQLYIPWFLQRGEIFGEPEQIRFRDMVLREDNTPAFIENALNIPIYILHGGDDENVPPIQGRMMVQYLKELDYECVYNEVEGKGHWWDVDSTPGVDCVDLKEMVNFLRDKKKDPYPKKIYFKTSNIGHSNKAYWIRIDELENIYQDAKIVATVDSLVRDNDFLHPYAYYVKISTENISCFTILLKEFNTTPKDILFNINGIQYKWKDSGEDEIVFTKLKDQFKIEKRNKKELKKTPDLYGPIKQAYFSPFILVYGTIGDSIDTENNLNNARLQSYVWWIRGNGYTEIIPDTGVTKEHITNFNLILFGNSQTNEIIKKINKQLPINFINDSRVHKVSALKPEPYKDWIAIKNKILTYPDLCLMEIYPNPLNPKKFVLLYSPTTKRAQKYLGLFPVIHSGSGLPDFIVWSPSTAKYGWAGVIAAGFFDRNWEIDNSLFYMKR